MGRSQTYWKCKDREYLIFIKEQYRRDLIISTRRYSCFPDTHLIKFSFS
jgi:hypothetical protein